jgi:hypothetical protein
MESLQRAMDEYQEQLKRGKIQVAYKGLMDYVMGLRTHFKKKFPELGVSGSIYYGYMDMTYFSIFPKKLKDRKLKIALVFLHEEFRFEVWLSGVNREVQTEYWQMVKDHGWDKYKLVSPGVWVDSILEHILVGDPDFSDLDALTQQIETGTVKFIQDVENFFSSY